MHVAEVERGVSAESLLGDVGCARARKSSEKRTGDVELLLGLRRRFQLVVALGAVGQTLDVKVGCGRAGDASEVVQRSIEIHVLLFHGELFLSLSLKSHLACRSGGELFWGPLSLATRNILGTS